MSNQTQQQIDALIQFINDAEDPGAVTNLIVAAVLAFLADKVKTMATASALSTEVAALEAVDASLNQAIQNEATARQAADSVETNARIDADTALSGRITSLQNAFNNLVSGDVTTAIETFNEVISFLADVTDDKTLTGLLSTINDRLNGVDDHLEEKADLHPNTGKVIYGQMPDIVLASMGSTLDSINAPSGTSILYRPSYKDYYFDPNDNLIKYVDTSTTRELGLPKQGLIYCNKMSDLTYRWTGSRWQQVGGGPGSAIDVVNGLNSTDGAKALAAAQGNVLKTKINEVYQALQTVYSLLGNAAFWGEKSPVATVLPDLNWNSTMYAVTINKVNSNIVIKRGGIPITGSSFQAEEGATVTLTFEGSSTYELLTVTVNGTSVQKTNGVFTYSFTVNGNMTLSINGTGNVITQPITVTKTLNGCSVVSESGSPHIGGMYSLTIAPPTGGSITSVTAVMEGGTLSVVDSENNGKTISTSNITGDITITVATESDIIQDVKYNEHNSPNPGVYVSDTVNGVQSTSNYIDIEGYVDLLYIFGAKYQAPDGNPGVNNFCMAFYDEDKNYLGYRNNQDRCGWRQLSSFKTGDLATAKYIRFTFWKTSAFEVTTAHRYTQDGFVPPADGNPIYGAGVWGRATSNDPWECIYDVSSYVEIESQSES